MQEHRHPSPAPTLDARGYMLCWNPHTDQVALVPWPDRVGASRSPIRYRCTTLACFIDFHRMNFEQRKAKVMIEAYHLIVADGCDPAAVHRALWPLEEYRDSLAPDFPEPGASLRWSFVRSATTRQREERTT